MSFDPRLGSAFGFDADDLAANRNGGLSAEQARMFAAVASYGRGQTRVLIPLFVLLLVGAGVLAVTTSGPDALPALAVVVVMGTFMLALVAFFGGRTQRDRAVQAAGRVYTVDGRWEQDSDWDGDWVVRIGEVTFGVELLQEQALQPGAAYRAHFLPSRPHAMLLSIEKA